MASFYEELQNSDSISDEKENAQSRANVDKWIFRLFLFLIGVMPLIVMANVEEVISPLISNVDILASGTKGDLFTHYKALLVLIVTIITSVLLLVKIFFMDGTIRKTFLNYVLGIFVLVILISTIMSPNISIALSGLYNRSDGAISWLCYVALMFIAMNIEYPKNVIRYIMYTMMPFVFINLYIITMNFYGKDLLQNSWMQGLVSIMLPEGANISEGSTLVGTLNQWNYMSGMFAMMTVMYLAWAITSTNWFETIVGAIVASASIAVMFMAVSKSGFLTVTGLFFIILIAIFLKEKKVQAITAIIVFLVITVPIFNILAEKDSRIWPESFGIFIEKNPYFEEGISNIKLNNIVYANNKIFELPELPEKSWSAGSGRIYIWGKTLNLVQDRILQGYGSDSLIYNFPHYNIDARSGLWDENTITDKAHNEFISILYGFGVFGLIVLIILFIMVCLTTFKSLILKSWNIFILAITNLAYFIQSIFNDSLPSISTIAFLFIGIMLVLIISKREVLN